MFLGAESIFLEDARGLNLARPVSFFLSTGDASGGCVLGRSEPWSEGSQSHSAEARSSRDTLYICLQSRCSEKSRVNRSRHSLVVIVNVHHGCSNFGLVRVKRGSQNLATKVCNYPWIVPVPSRRRQGVPPFHCCMHVQLILHRLQPAGPDHTGW